MFNAPFANSSVTWSPMGTLVQVENAKKATTTGPPAVALKNKDTIVFLSVAGNDKEHTTLPTRVFNVRDNCGATFGGIQAHGKMLVDMFRSNQLEREYIYADDPPICRMVNDLAIQMQASSQHHNRLVHGAGLIVGCCEEEKPILYLLMPGGFLEVRKAVCIGENQSKANEYLLDHLDEITASSKTDLIIHGIRAMLSALQASPNADKTRLSIGIVGKDLPFHLYSAEETDEYVKVAIGKKNVRELQLVDAFEEVFPNMSSDNVELSSSSNYCLK